MSVVVFQKHGDVALRDRGRWGGWWDLVILEVFANHNDSRMLCFSLAQQYILCPDNLSHL